MSEIAVAIAELLESSPDGRKWIARQRKRMKLEDTLMRLHRQAVSDGILRELWHAGDISLAQNLDGLTSEQVRQLNAAWSDISPEPSPRRP